MGFFSISMHLLCCRCVWKCQALMWLEYWRKRVSPGSWSWNDQDHHYRCHCQKVAEIELVESTPARRQSKMCQNAEYHNNVPSRVMDTTMNSKTISNFKLSTTMSVNIEPAIVIQHPSMLSLIARNGNQMPSKSESRADLGECILHLVKVSSAVELGGEQLGH